MRVYEALMMCDTSIASCVLRALVATPLEIPKAPSALHLRVPFALSCTEAALPEEEQAVAFYVGSNDSGTQCVSLSCSIFTCSVFILTLFLLELLGPCLILWEKSA